MEKSSFSENVRVSRIKTLLYREGLKQKDLAEMIEVRSKDGEIVSMEPQNLSRCLQSGKISEKLCRKIIKLFPKYRIEWLLGYDDYPTTADQFSAVINQSRHEGDLLQTGLFSLAEVMGFSISPTKTYPDQSIENIIAAIKTGLTFSRDGRSVSFSLAELNAFENEIADYVEFRLLHMMK